MYLCQQLEQMTDRRYRRDWRVVWFKVVMLPDMTLVWHRHRDGPWRGSGFWNRAQSPLQGRIWTQGKSRAEKDLLKNVPIWSRVFHGAKVTGKQAETLTNILSPISLDRLKDAGDELTMPELCNYRPAKEKPSKLYTTTKELESAKEKLVEYERRASRMMSLQTKWERRVRILQRRVDKLTGAVTNTQS